jgi:hypothetical protein
MGLLLLPDANTLINLSRIGQIELLIRSGSRIELTGTIYPELLQTSQGTNETAIQATSALSWLISENNGIVARVFVDIQGARSFEQSRTDAEERLITARIDSLRYSGAIDKIIAVTDDRSSVTGPDSPYGSPADALFTREYIGQLFNSVYISGNEYVSVITVSGFNTRYRRDEYFYEKDGAIVTDINGRTIETVLFLQPEIIKLYLIQEMRAYLMAVRDFL